MKFEDLYKTKIGRVLACAAAQPFISRVAGAFMDSRLSRFMIKPFVRKNGIDLSQTAQTEYVSFNAFFTRRLKEGARPVWAEANALISPCDGLLSVYSIDDKSAFTIKGQAYTLKTLLEDDAAARQFYGGTCLVFRLTPAHYHRYIFPADGTIIKSRHINGAYHTVRPEALENVPVFKTNTREYVYVQTPLFGHMIQMEVGATLVGRIVNAKTGGAFRKGEEKGYFEFGGSTIVLLFEKDALYVDARFAGDAETDVCAGERIGASPR